MFLNANKQNNSVRLLVNYMFLCLLNVFASTSNAGQGLNAQPKVQRIKTEAIIVDVNSERRQVPIHDMLTVVRGDLLIVVDVVVSPATDLKPKVDVSGYEDTAGQAANDLGKIIDTSSEMQGGKALKDGGRRFPIKIYGKGFSKSELYLTIIDPQLIFFEIEINGQRRRVTDKERLSLAPSDEVRVVDIRTNVRGNENVKHDLVTKNWSDGTPRKEIRFSRGSFVFARIPIDWKGS